jgi:hypothetical protein
METPRTLTVDGTEYEVTSFSQQVQQLVVIHTQWKADATKERLALAKTEAAVRAVEAELSQLVGKEIAARNAPANDEAAPAAK